MISKIKLLSLVVILTLMLKLLTAIKLNYLMSALIHGRRKLHFLSAHLSEFNIRLHLGWHVFSIAHYGIISRKSSALIFGGYCDRASSSLIARYTIDKWERVGYLRHSRYSHRAIANNDRIYVVGGNGNQYVFHFKSPINVSSFFSGKQKSGRSMKTKIQLAWRS